MDRINSANTTDLGGGKRGFKDENVAAGTAGTDVSAAHMNASQEEILYVIEQNGLVPDANDWTQLYQAVQNMQAVDASSVLFVNTYPTILNALGTCNLTIPAAGQIAFDAFNWLWRGFKKLQTAGQTFATVANKTYHLKVSYDLGTDTQTVTLFDAADIGYNPALVPEWHRSLDAGYDEIFIATIVTDGANSPTFYPMINMAQLYAADDIPAVPGGLILDDTNPSAQTIDVTYTLNWARDCNAALVGISDISEASAGGEYGFGVRSSRNAVYAWWGRTVANTDGVNMAFVARA